MNGDAPPRHVWLCADDYGLSPGVNRAIRDLIARGRLNATSVMVVGSAIGRDEVDALNTAASDNPRCAIGLHATLSAPFHPLTMHFRPLDGGLFPPFPKLLRASLLRRLDVEMLGAELTAQIAAFTALFGRAPDYVDGHQHVQLFPQVRDAFLGGREGNSAQRLGAPGRAQPAAGATACKPQGIAARHLERAVPAQRLAQPASPSMRDLPAPTIFRGRRISAACCDGFSAGCRTAAWSCVIPALSTTPSRRSTR